MRSILESRRTTIFAWGLIAAVLIFPALQEWRRYQEAAEIARIAALPPVYTINSIVVAPNHKGLLVSEFRMINEDSDTAWWDVDLVNVSSIETTPTLCSVTRVAHSAAYSASSKHEPLQMYLGKYIGDESCLLALQPGTYALRVTKWGESISGREWRVQAVSDPFEWSAQ